DAAPDARAGGVSVEIGPRRWAAEPPLDRDLRHGGEVLDVGGRVVEGGVVDGGAVLERRADLAEPLGRGAIGLRQRVALGEDKKVVLVEVGERLSPVEIAVPRLELPFLERAAAAMGGDPELAVPGARIGREDERERRALVSLVARERQEQ